MNQTNQTKPYKGFIASVGDALSGFAGSFATECIWALVYISLGMAFAANILNVNVRQIITGHEWLFIAMILNISALRILISAILEFVGSLFKKEIKDEEIG